jgi:Ca2+-binding EF-hand superfamily protein
MLGALLPEQMAQLREVFDAFDGNRDGLLDSMEVGTVAQLCGFQMSQAEVRTHGWACSYCHSTALSFGCSCPQVVHIVAEMAPITRKLGFADFVSVLTRPLPGVSPDDEMRRTFGKFAAADVITVDSLHAAFGALGHPVSVLMASDMLREADLDEDGLVSREDFLEPRAAGSGALQTSASTGADDDGGAAAATQTVA